VYRPKETEYSILRKYCVFVHGGMCGGKSITAIDRSCQARGCPLQAKLRKFRRARSKRLGARARTKARGKY